MIELPRCQVVRVANYLSSRTKLVLPWRRQLELWWEDHPHPGIGSLDDESCLVGLENEAMELFFPDDLPF